MKYAMFSWFGYLQPFEERLKVVKEAGFDGVMFSWADETWPDLVKKEDMPDIIRKNGLYIENMHLPYLGYNPIWGKDGIERQQLQKDFKEYLIAANTHGIDNVVMHTCDMDPFEYDLSQGLDFFREIEEAADRYEVNVAIENIIRKDILDMLLTELESEYVGLCYDSSHDYITQEEGTHWILEKYKHRLKALHISDNNFEKDCHWIPGSGKIDFTLVKEILMEIDSDYISYECIAREDWRDKEPIEFAQALYNNTVFGNGNFKK
jgi:sugar phosphate isomerase/epimerase